MILHIGRNFKNYAFEDMKNFNSQQLKTTSMKMSDNDNTGTI